MGGLRAALTGLLGLAAAGPATALEPLSPDGFLDIADGKLLTFYNYPGNFLVGVEEYLNRDLSVWRDTSGECVYGHITVDDGKLCFLYDGDPDGFPICWWPFTEGDRIFVRVARFGEGEIQEVVSISEGTLSCPSAPTS